MRASLGPGVSARAGTFFPSRAPTRMAKKALVLGGGFAGLEAAMDMRGAFNDLSLTLLPGASERGVIARV